MVVARQWKRELLWWAAPAAGWARWRERPLRAVTPESVQAARMPVRVAGAIEHGDTPVSALGLRHPHQAADALDPDDDAPRRPRRDGNGGIRRIRADGQLVNGYEAVDPAGPEVGHDLARFVV